MTKYFGTDGIRSKTGDWPLVPEFVLKLGMAAGETARRNSRWSTILVGRDTRHSGMMLQQALSAGLLASGVQVIDLGVIPTPGVSWLVRHLNADAGVVISASHNPVDQNGIKIFGNDGKKLPEDVEEKIEDLVDSSIANSMEALKIHRPLGELLNGESYRERYLRSLLDEHPHLDMRKLKIIVDCANGAASFIAPVVLSRLGAKVVTINASPDGMNINQNAGSEHVRRFPQDMYQMVLQHSADFGLAFDGDADRVVFVDENGTLIDGDHMLGFLSHYFDTQGSLLCRTVVTTIMRNSGLKSHLAESGILLVETPVGDKYVTDQIFHLRELDQFSGKFGIGGEQAGHILIVDNDHPTGDGLRTAIFVIRAYLESELASMARFAEGVGKTPQIIASAHVGSGPRYSKFELAGIEEDFFSGFPGLIRVNFRYSGTEPLFRVMLESDGQLSETELAHIATRICLQAQEYSGTNGGIIDILNTSKGGVIPAG